MFETCKIRGCFRTVAPESSLCQEHQKQRINFVNEMGRQGMNRTEASAEWDREMPTWKKNPGEVL